MIAKDVEVAPPLKELVPDQMLFVVSLVGNRLTGGIKIHVAKKSHTRCAGSREQMVRTDVAYIDILS